MSKIGDELRDYCKKVLCYTHYYDKFWYFADRIDREMVELPKDKDGVPIHVGDTVYLKDGRKYHVSRVNIARDHTSIDVHPCGTGGLFFSIEPTRFTHTRPDSWERIADELEEWSEDNRVNGDDEIFSRAREIAKRIRKLAAKEDEQ